MLAQTFEHLTGPHKRPSVSPRSESFGSWISKAIFGALCAGNKSLEEGKQRAVPRRCSAFSWLELDWCFCSGWQMYDQGLTTCGQKRNSICFKLPTFAIAIKRSQARSMALFPSAVRDHLRASAAPCGSHWLERHLWESWMLKWSFRKQHGFSSPCWIGKPSLEKFGTNLKLTNLE